ncbi:MAG: type II toxin-antitoxin system VapC family toxin [Bryobacteraceae bacterium]|jgi:PIN domain nuclease of toxin-antitoxin system
MTGDGRVPLLLDTHFWIWLQNGEPGVFTAPIRRAIDASAAGGRLYLSIISVWEVALLESKGRIELSLPCGLWVQQALAIPGLAVAPLTPEIAIESCNLPPPFHGDPADRIIVATARNLGARLLTRDRNIIEYGRKRHFSLL